MRSYHGRFLSLTEGLFLLAAACGGQTSRCDGAELGQTLTNGVIKSVDANNSTIFVDRCAYGNPIFRVIISSNTKLVRNGAPSKIEAISKGDKIYIAFNSNTGVASNVEVHACEEGQFNRAASEHGEPATIVAEGVGKDEKAARKAAFREAVSKVVGTLIDAETLVKNDQIVSERILEFSGGFIKTYEVLKTDAIEGGLIRVRIKAVVEKLQIIGKLDDANVATVKKFKGSDLLAERLTKNEARKNATDLITKLLQELPSMMQADVVGKPRFDNDEETILIDLEVSVHQQKYGQFVKKATALFDKLAIYKTGVMLKGTTKPNEQGFMTYSRASASLFGKPDLGDRTPKGWQVWILTSSDYRFGSASWNTYWIDSDIAQSLRSVAGETHLHLALGDDNDQLITAEDVVKLGGSASSSSGYGTAGWWLLYHPYTRQYLVDGKQRETVSLVIAPFAMKLGNYAKLELSGDLEASYSQKVKFQRKIRLTDDELERVTSIKASVKLHTEVQQR